MRERPTGQNKCTVLPAKAVLRYSGGDELGPPQDDLCLGAGDPPKRLVVEEEYEVSRPEAGVAGGRAARVQAADEGSAQVERQGLQLQACI